MSKFISKPIRRSQLISPFGVGSIVDFPNDTSVMIAGLDVWSYSKDNSEEVFHEERLQSLLNVNSFKIPPNYAKSSEEIPAVRFPRWHYCPSCKIMEKVNLTRNTKYLNCRYCEKSGKRFRLIPVRFVTVCSSGHISDFPFKEWAHRNSKELSDCDGTLKYTAGKSSTLDGIKISCSCGSFNTMRDAFNKDVFTRQGIKCQGHRPWLGEIDHNYGCNKQIQTVQKGASNIYFPIVHSSIYLPLWAEKNSNNIIKVLEDSNVWSLLSGQLENGCINPFISENMAKIYNVDKTEFYEAAIRKLKGEEANINLSEQDFRYAEYSAYLNERGNSNSDLFVEKKDLKKYECWLSDFFQNIISIHKLRETRALSGFTRLIPHGESIDGEENAEVVESMELSKGVDWLPAIIVRGEGIFFEFKDDALRQWLNNSNAQEKVSRLSDRLNSSRAQRGLSHIELSPKFVLLHTFAHSIIKQLCFDCGYGSSALRERIYYNDSDNEKMHGVLIYTAAGDSEGTMGGLVRSGEAGKLEKTILRSLQNAMWCSSDPICSESQGQGTSNANLAACHNCVLLPETSCEEGNRYLDRNLLIGGINDRRNGFFARLFEVG